MSTRESLPLRAVVGRRLAAISALFLVLVALFMVANAYLLATVDPLNTPALKTLSERLDQDPANAELRQQVRELDWLARRAFFIRQWQLQTGAWLLFGAGAALILSLQLALSGRAPAPEVHACPGQDDPWSAAVRARSVIAGAGILALAGLALFSLRVRPHARIPALDVDTADAVAEARARAEPDPAAATSDWPGEAQRHWPSFRGPGGLGVAEGRTPPTAWDGASGAGVLWKSVVPRSGFNSPVVWGDRVFLTGADEDKREVYGYDAHSGALLWTADTEGVPGAPAALPAVAADTGYAAPSVATDGRRVVALFGTGVLLGLDFDGRRLWARRLPVPDNHYGHASSLLIYRDMVYVQYDHFGGSELMALDLETGHPRWERMREADISWASPALIESGGRMQLILQAAPMVTAHDARSGEELWSNECMSGEIGSSPAYAAGRVFAANQYAQAVALDSATGEEIWSNNRLELPDAGSPVATERHLFLPTSFGVFSCIDAADGSLVWEHEFDAGGYGSPVLAGARIYWVTADGKTRIFKAADSFELIAEPALGEASVSTPALVGDRLYIRGEHHLFCIGPE